MKLLEWFEAHPKEIVKVLFLNENKKKGFIAVYAEYLIQLKKLTREDNFPIPENQTWESLGWDIQNFKIKDIWRIYWRKAYGPSIIYMRQTNGPT